MTSSHRSKHRTGQKGVKRQLRYKKKTDAASIPSWDYLEKYAFLTEIRSFLRLVYWPSWAGWNVTFESNVI